MSESCHIRAVTKISSHWVYVVNGRGIEQLESSFGSIFIFFPWSVYACFDLLLLKKEHRDQHWRRRILMFYRFHPHSNLWLLLLVPVYTSWMFDFYLLKSKCKYCTKIFYHHQQTVQKDSYMPCNDCNAQGLWDCSPWCEEEAVKDRKTNN